MDDSSYDKTEEIMSEPDHTLRGPDIIHNRDRCMGNIWDRGDMSEHAGGPKIGSVLLQIGFPYS